MVNARQKLSVYLYISIVVFALSGLSLFLYDSGVRADQDTPPEFAFIESVEGIAYGEYSYYHFIVTDTEEDIATLEVEIDDLGREDVPPYDLVLDSQTEEADYYVDLTTLDDGLEHTITFYVTDTLDNEAIQSFSFTVGHDSDEPEMVFTQSDSGTINYPTQTELVYEFTVTDATSKIKTLYYCLLEDGSCSYEELLPVDEELDSSLEEVYFTLQAEDYLDGEERSIFFIAGDEAENEVYSAEFAFVVVEIDADDVTPPTFDFTLISENTITDSYFLNYEFSATDLSNNIISFEYEVDGGTRVAIEAVDGEFDGRTEEGVLELNAIDYDDDTQHTITFYAKDILENEASQVYNFTVDVNFEAPDIDFTQTHSGLTPERFHYIGTAYDTTGIKLIQFKFGVQDFVSTTHAFGDFSDTTEQYFDYNFSAIELGLPEGANMLDIFVTDIDNNVTNYNFELDIDKGIPTCSATWPNLPTPHYSNVVTYPQFNCTDNRAITSATYNVYHAVWGDIYPDVPLDPVDSAFGEASEDFTFTFTLNPAGNLDGRLIQEFIVKDAAGNASNDYDEIVIEYRDDFPPVLQIDAITPDPSTDTTPRLTGSCGDITNFDTNTNLTALEYNIDSTGWSSLPVLSGSLNDSHTETYSYDLPELAEGSHSVSVRCTDGAGRSTTETDEFEIVAINETAEPGEFEYVDSFDSHIFQDISNTDLVWGNGQLRLREDIPSSRTLITDDNYLPKYSLSRNRYKLIKDLVNPELLWFTTNQRVSSYNKQTQAITHLDPFALFGVANFGGIKDLQVSIYEGDEILWISEDHAIYALNLNSNLGVRYPINTAPGSFVPDTDRGRLAIYFLRDEGAAGAGNNSVTYWDLNGTLTDTGDDTIFNHDNDFYGLSITNVVKIAKKPGTNYLYVSPYGTGRVVKIDDNNTPTNQADDTMDYYSSSDADHFYYTVFAFTFDPDNNVIFGTDNNSHGQVYVVNDENGTPMDLDDDTVTVLNDPIDLGYKGVGDLTYIQGEDNIGDQIFIHSYANNPIYLNFNSTYTDRLDDTFIEFNVNNGIRPNTIISVVDDYNTFYSNVDQQGLFRIDMERGWVESGQAVGVPQRPSNKLILNNFVADATAIDPIAIGAPADDNLFTTFGNLIFPKVQAQQSEGISYYLSNDDGVTWVPVTLGEIKQLSPADYNVRFRIDMVTIGGATPVLNSYTLNFVGYTTPEQAEEVADLIVTNTPSSTNQNTNFSLVIEAVDELGFPVVGNTDDITLTLINTGNDSVSTGLNKSNVTLSDGSISLTDVQISTAGTFVIRASNGTFTKDSSPIIVNGNNTTPVPTISFYADKYIINPGESITLGWNSSHLTSLSITPDVGSVASSGSFTLTPTGTTNYIISGSGDYGSLSAGFTVVMATDTTTTTTTTTVPVSFVTTVTPVSIDEVNYDITIETIGDLIVNKGDKVTFTWKVDNANNIYIDYLGKDVATRGSFDFIAEESVDITITAKNGDNTESKTVKITVVNSSLLGNLQELTPVIETISALPSIELGLIAVLNSAFVGSLLLNILNTGSFSLTLTTLQNLLMVAGILPHKKRKGYVYQTQTIKGIPFATINIKSAEDNRILATITTDLDGTYYYPSIAKGNYYLDVKQSENRFPTYLDRSLQLSVYDFYKGEQLGITNNKESQTIVIPMDMINPGEVKIPFKTRFILLINRLLVWLQWTLYPMFAFSLIAAFIYPNVLNAIIAGIYSVMILVKVIQHLKLPTLKVHVKNRIVGEGVKGAFVELRDANRALVAIGKTNSKGVAKFYVRKDVYSVTINANNFVSEGGFAELKTVDLNSEVDFEFYVVPAEKSQWTPQ